MTSVHLYKTLTGVLDSNQTLSMVEGVQYDAADGNQTMEEKELLGLSVETCPFVSIGHVSTKFVLVVCFGSIVAFAGVLQNILLCYLYLSRAKFRDSNMVFLGLAAFFDAILDGSYVFLMSVSVLYEYYQSITLCGMWHSYVRIMNSASQTSMTASSFLLVSATGERYRTNIKWPSSKGFTWPTRVVLTVVSVSAAIGIQGPTYFELETNYKPECLNSSQILSAYSVTPSRIARVPEYNTIFQFWIRKLTTVCLPFVLLCYFNLAILTRLTRLGGEPPPMGPVTTRGGAPASSRSSYHQRPAAVATPTTIEDAVLSLGSGGRAADEHRQQRNRATRTMVIVATSYLIVHSLNFFLASWEMIDKDTLYKENLTFYTFAADACSILAVFGNVIRLPIYLTSNNEIRVEFIRLLRSSLFLTECGDCKRKKTDSGRPEKYRKTMAEDGQFCDHRDCDHGSRQQPGNGREQEDPPGHTKVNQTKLITFGEHAPVNPGAAEGAAVRVYYAKGTNITEHEIDQTNNCVHIRPQRNLLLKNGYGGEMDLDDDPFVRHKPFFNTPNNNAANNNSNNPPQHPHQHHQQQQQTRVRMDPKNGGKRPQSIFHHQRRKRQRWWFNNNNNNNNKGSSNMMQKSSNILTGSSNIDNANVYLSQPTSIFYNGYLQPHLTRKFIYSDPENLSDL